MSVHEWISTASTFPSTHSLMLWFLILSLLESGGCEVVFLLLLQLGPSPPQLALIGVTVFFWWTGRKSMLLSQMRQITDTVTLDYTRSTVSA